MAITVSEKPESRGGSRGDSENRELIYTILGTADDGDAYDALEEASPIVYDGLVRRSWGVKAVGVDEEENTGTWAGKFHFALNGQLPDADHPGNFVVLQEPIPAGELGRAMVAGVTPVQVTIRNESDQYAEVRSDGEDGWDFLSGSVGSAQILWHQPGTGVQWSLIRLGNRVAPQIFPARITGGSTGAWEWTEIVPGTWGDKAGGLSSDTEGTILELNGNPLGVDDRVFVQPLFVHGTGWIYVAHDDSRLRPAP